MRRSFVLIDIVEVLEVTAPRVNDRRPDEETGQRRRFLSVILPPYARRSPKVTEVLPLLYLHGLSTKGFVPALAEYFGTEAGLSASAINRLSADWAAEAEAFCKKDLSKSRYVYVWADGVYGVRLGEDRKLLFGGVGSWSLDAAEEERQPRCSVCSQPALGFSPTIKYSSPLKGLLGTVLGLPGDYPPR